MKWWTRGHGWALTALLILLVSCSGNAGTISPAADAAVGGTPVTAAQQPGADPPGTDLSGFAVVPIQGSDHAELALAVEQHGGQLTVGVAAAAPQVLSELLCQLSYDPSQYTPLAAQATGAITPLNESLCLQTLDTPGVVSLGQVALDGATRPVEEGAVLAEVLFACEALADTAARTTSQAPAHARALSPLLWDEQSGELTWYLVNPGDFNQDGLVGVSDLSPLGREYGASGPFAFETALSAIDGNGDGLIGIGDLALIGHYWDCHVEGYNLYASDDIAQVPLSFAEPSSIAPLTSFSLAEARGDPLTDRLWFSYTPEPGQDELLYWVRPYGDGTEGTRSNVNGPGVESAATEPGGDGFNLPPTARLSLSYEGQSIPLAVSFDAGASSDPDGAIVFYEWDYQGDGLFDAFSTAPLAEYTYTQPGTYSPLVRVTDGGGLWDTFQSPPFEVTDDGVSNIPPVADIMATATKGEAPLTVGLIAAGSFDPDGYIEKYEWDFDGDGEYDLDSGADPTVLHAYETAGTYDAAVQVTDNRAATGVATVQITTTAANQPPEAWIAIDPGEDLGHAPHTVHFDASRSSDPEDRLKCLWWDVDGDGRYEWYTFTPYYTHTYTTPGLFNASILVEDQDGNWDTTTVMIDVLAPVPQVGELVPSVTYGDVPLTVCFQALGWTPADGSIVKYEWDFDGDGTFDGSGSQELVCHTYHKHGVYSAQVRMTDDAGRQGTGTAIMRVNEVFTGNGAWPCFGHDQRHTGRSPYLGAQTSSLRWSFGTSANLSSPAIGMDGTIYVGGGRGKLYAIGPDGSLKWAYTTSTEWPYPAMVSSPAIGADGTVYVGGFDNKVYAINPDGSHKWSFTTGWSVRSAALVGPDGSIYVSCFDGKLYALNPDGSLKWSYDMTVELQSSPAMGADGTVYVGSFRDFALHAINPDGSKKWSYATGYIVPSSPAVDTDGTVYVGSTDNKLYAINPDGSLKWSFSTGDRVEASPAIGADGTVYVGSFDNDLYAVNPDGSLNWSFATGGHIRSSPAIGADGTVYVGSDDMKFYAVNPDGTEKWSCTPGVGLFSAPAIGADGTVYASCGSKLYAFGQQDMQIHVVDGAEYSGRHSSLAVVNRNPAICYSYDSPDAQSLMYSRACTASGSTWDSRIVLDTKVGTAVGEYSSLAIVSADFVFSGYPAISYFDEAEGLKYVRANDANGDSWRTPAILDGADDVGMYTSLAVKWKRPAISYYDAANGDLKYVRATDYRGDSWSDPPTTIDSDGDVGQYTALAVVYGNVSAISYYDATNGDLKFVHETDSSGNVWGTPIIVDSAGDVGLHTSLAMVNGQPAISYYDATNGDLKFVRALHRSGIAWDTPITVDSDGDVGLYTSLAVVNNLPVISYQSVSPGGLRYISATDEDGSSWGAPVMLDPGATDFHYGTSLTEVNGRAGISYSTDGGAMSQTDMVLKYVY